MAFACKLDESHRKRFARQDVEIQFSQEGDFVRAFFGGRLKWRLINARN